MESSSKISLIFPTSLYTVENLLTKEENQNISNKVIQLSNQVPNGDTWNCNTINSLGVYDLTNDSTFYKINKLVTEKVNDFARFYKSNHYYQITDSWYNISLPGSFQEGHTHPRSTFSCVYYPCVPEKSGDLVLYNPDSVSVSMRNLELIDTYNSMSHTISPTEGFLIIFKSSIRHMVTLNKSEMTRISLSYNFD